MKLLQNFQKTGKTYWREILAVLFLLVGIFFFRSERKELNSLEHHIRAANITWIWLGISVTTLYILLQSGMYVTAFSAIAGKLSWVQAIELFLKRNFLSVFLPAGGISSLAYSPSSIRQSGLTKMQVHQASGIYAFVGLLTVFIVGVPVLVYSFWQTKNIRNAGQGLLVLFVILGGAYLIFRSFQQKGRLYQWVQKKFPRFIPSVDELFSANVLSQQFIYTVLFSLGVECCGILHLFIAAKALGLQASLSASAIAYIVSVLMMIISPFLKGLGAVELSMVYILSLYGYTPVNALAITILYRLFEFWLPLVAGFLSYAWKGRHIFARIFPAFLVFALGVINILSVITPPIASRLKLLHEFIPIASIDATNVMVLLIGMILLVTSAFLIMGQRNAWIFALVLSALSLLGHLFKALDYEEAILAASVIIILLFSIKQYRLKSNTRLLQLGLKTTTLIFLAVLIFGFIGFYFIDKRHFGIEFSWRQSLLFSCRNFLLMNHEGVQPITRFGHEFIWLAHILGFIAWGFLVFTIFKPYFHGRQPAITSREKAFDLIKRFGDSPVDHFKTYHDKLFYFSDQFEAFMAYRIANGFAIVLEEPVCAEEFKIPVLQEFDRHCRKMGLKTAYYRVDETSISYFNYLKKRKLLIGQEALLELDKFTLEGREKKSLRNALNSLQKKGFNTSVCFAPLKKELVAELKYVSDEWLKHYEKKEIVFSQGIFDEKEIIQQDVIIIRDATGVIKAFLNIIPDFAPEECTYDLLRRTADAPGGCMDGLIIELVKYAKEKKLKYLNLGLVPMAGIEQAENTAERLIRYAYEKIKRFRHYTGLREFKEKYASAWVNKYLVYENDFDLIQLPGALNKVMQPSSR
ncbi:MAG TPA: phosphatidylglycerol lysyltransferase domain-containing protein [Chitinophagaceae bacterium]|nr:phosphatidylglycerol lysyltransferase domain-containing protein [Chitinophagaceae bacterium]